MRQFARINEALSVALGKSFGDGGSLPDLGRPQPTLPIPEFCSTTA